jgi:hypothetical protein
MLFPFFPHFFITIYLCTCAYIVWVIPHPLPHGPAGGSLVGLQGGGLAGGGGMGVVARLFFQRIQMWSSLPWARD